MVDSDQSDEELRPLSTLDDVTHQPRVSRVFHTHLADAARLAEGADGTHVALVAGAEGWGVHGGGVQSDGRVGPHISQGLQVVALAEQEVAGGGGQDEILNRS